MHIIECVVENIASLLLVQPTDEQYFQYTLVLYTDDKKKLSLVVVTLSLYTVCVATWPHLDFTCIIMSIVLSYTSWYTGLLV